MSTPVLTVGGPVRELSARGSGPTPNVVDYATARPLFSWDEEAKTFDGLPGGNGFNIAHEAVDRHAAGERSTRTAVRWLGKSAETRAYTFADLSRASSRFANVLAGLGVEPGGRVFLLLGRIPELHTVVLGTLKARGVVCPLFPAFGPEPIRARLAIGEGSVLVTTPALYRAKVAPIRASLNELRHVLLIGSPAEIAEVAGGEDCRGLMAAASDAYVIGPTSKEDAALLHFTSGTTGRPKGAIHVHGAALAHHVTGRLALDLHDDDVFWCTADPGWVTGMSYGIISPLTNGVTSVVLERDFDAERWYRTLQDECVTVWYTAPTAIRMLMKAGLELPRRFDLRHLRLVASVGEPLNPEAVEWGVEALGLPVLDNWWQTETGGIMIANFRSVPVRPGSMGLPLPGIDAGIVHRTGDGHVEELREPGRQGELALRPGWPSMFRGYLHDAERYQHCFADGWYLTGDLARRDADGYFWFVGRADDVIKSSGHLIGPFEVESVLLEHRAVAEAAVIGVPDPVAGEIVSAYVALRRGFEPAESLRLELLGFARARLGAVVAPKTITFIDSVPKTRSGKIMRRLLKARALGLPEGDTSTLEQESP